MKHCILAALLVLCSCIVTTSAISQEIDNKACQQAIQTSCTTCHGVQKICHELGEADADWSKIVKKMGEKGNIPQEAQDVVLNCLTKADDPKQFVCTK